MESSVVSRKTTVVSAAVNIFCVIVIALGFLSVFSADWYIRVYGDMGFAAVIYKTEGTKHQTRLYYFYAILLRRHGAVPDWQV